MADMNEYTPELYELVDSEGHRKNFELVDAVELNGEQYYAMIPAIEDEDYLNADCDLVILKSVYEDDEEVLASIDDEDEYDRISALFLERMEDAMAEMDCQD